MIEPEGIEVRAAGLPLIATFGRAEKESAAAAIVMACQDAGAWRAVSFAEIATACKSRVGQRGFEWLSNPFCRPDIWGLVDDGFAEWTDEPGGRVALTERGISVLASSRWAKSSQEPTQ